MENRIGRKFMDQTRFPHLGRTDQMNGIPEPPLELPCPPEKPRIRLPGSNEFPVAPITLVDAIRKRESVREYAATPLSMRELAFAVWSAQGVKEQVEDAVTFRTVPSAGARHAFELYLLVNRVTGLTPGLYRYLALEHELAALDLTGEVAHHVGEGCLGQQCTISAAVLFIWTAVPYRMTWRYGERGYRYLHLDAGHSCENLYLAGEAIGCGVCAVAAFDDDLLNSALGIDGIGQFAIYLASLGKKP